MFRTRNAAASLTPVITRVIAFTFNRIYPHLAAATAAATRSGSAGREVVWFGLPGILLRL